MLVDYKYYIEDFGGEKISTESAFKKTRDLSIIYCRIIDDIAHLTKTRFDTVLIFRVAFCSSGCEIIHINICKITSLCEMCDVI